MKQFGENVCEAADEQLDQVNDNKVKPRPGKRADQFKRLVEACKHNQLETIKRLLTDRPELVNLHDKQHRNLLHYAAILVSDDEASLIRGASLQADSLECLGYLASRCESRLWFQVDQDGLTVLHLAVISCNNALVDEILFNRRRAHDIELAALVFALDKEHHSALHWAVITNNLECVRLLIEHSGVQLVHQADLNGATPLHYATQVSDYPKYRRQLRQMLKNATGSEEAQRTNSASSASSSSSCRGVSMREMNRPKATPDGEVEFAPNHNNNTLDILDFLVRLPGVNLECRDRDSRTPLLWAASSGNRQAILLLIQAGANYLSQDANVLGPLHCAASHGFTDCLECLLLAPMASSSRNQLINQVDHLNCTPLFYAVLSGNIDCVELLLERGAERDWQDVKGRTAAHFGALRGQLNTLKLLESRGANLWLANKQGDLPLHYAVKSGRQQVVAWLLERSPYERPVNAINNTGRAPIHLAVLKNNANMAEYLIRRGANLNQLMRIREKPKQTADGACQLAHQSGSSGPFHYETALDIASRLKQRHLVAMLERNSAKSAEFVLANRQPTEGIKQTNSTRGNVRSLFDLQAANVASPIGFETGGSSTEPPACDQPTGEPAVGGRVAWMPTLPRAMAEPMPQSSSGDSANSSALSQSSLTSLNLGRRRNQSAAEVDSGQQRDRRQQQQQPQQQAAARREGPFKGGLNYNNDRISASIRCKLYDRCNAFAQHSFPPISRPHEHVSCRQKHKSADSLPARSGGGGHQQEIVTNVNVYTSSPCAQCFRPIGSAEADGPTSDRKCLNCAPQGETSESRRLVAAAQKRRAKASATRSSNRRLADGQISETSDSTSEACNYDESEREDELGLANRDQFRLPALSSFESSKRGHLIDAHQVASHAPALRAYTQQLPVIMSAEEDRSTSGETGAAGQFARRRANEEEPRFDRSDQRGHVPARRPEHIRGQVRSPVADYIHSGDQNSKRRRSVSEVRGQRVRQPDYALPDYSQVRAKVDSHRNDSGLSSHFSDQLDGSSSLGGGGGRRSKSWSSSLAAPGDKERPNASSQFGQNRPPVSVNELRGDEEEHSRSCSRQTIIKTRRLSVDSDELASSIEKSIRRYKQESKLFGELQNLKRSQIRSGRANECLLVKRLVEHFRQELLQEGLVGVEAYRGPYTYQTYELYLYDQLKKLSQYNTALLVGGRVPHKFSHDQQQQQQQADESRQVAASVLSAEQAGDDDDARLSQKEAHDFLEEDMKAEQELRRVLERGSMDSAAAENLSSACEETIAIEPSGGLLDIRVRQGEAEQQVAPTSSAPSNVERHESDPSNLTEANTAQSVEADRPGANSRTEKLAEDLARQRLERQARNSSTGSSRRSSIEVEQERLERLPLWVASGQPEEETNQVALDASCERSQIERAANELTAAILVDALGNVSRAGSPPRFGADSRASEADGGGDAGSTQQQDEPADEATAAAAEAEAAESEADPAPERGRKRSVVNIGDKIEVIYHKVGIEIDTVAESEDQSDDSEHEERRELGAETEPAEEVAPESSSEAELAGEDASGSGEPTSEAGVQELDKAGGSRRRSSLAQVETLTSRSRARRASSPHVIGATGSRQVRRLSSPVGQTTADAMPTRRVFNGFDLDSLREHRRRHESVVGGGGGGGGTAVSTRRRSRAAQAGSKSTRLSRKARSQIPTEPYKVYVPIELIRDRWNQVKRLERVRKNELRCLSERRQMESELESAKEAESRGLEVAAAANEAGLARSQPNLAKLEPIATTVEKRVGLVAPDTCSNFILIYEVNKSARGARENLQPADEGDESKEQADEAKPASANKSKQIIWCQKRMTRIVDVRTLRRTLSLPESLIYSNELLKRFNLLRL